jgi:hypothetical protein
MPRAPRRSKANLKIDTFEAEMVDAARLYQLQVTQGNAKGYVAPEIAAFICRRCCARQVLLEEEKG